MAMALAISMMAVCMWVTGPITNSMDEEQVTKLMEQLKKGFLKITVMLERLMVQVVSQEIVIMVLGSIVITRAMSILANSRKDSDTDRALISGLRAINM